MNKGDRLTLNVSAYATVVNWNNSLGYDWSEHIRSETYKERTTSWYFWIYKWSQHGYKIQGIFLLQTHPDINYKYININYKCILFISLSFAHCNSYRFLLSFPYAQQVGDVRKQMQDLQIFSSIMIPLVYTQVGCFAFNFANFRSTSRDFLEWPHSNYYAID